MGHRDISRRALIGCMAAGLLAGCAGAPPPVVEPRTATQSARADGVHRRTSSAYQVLYRFDRYPNGSYPFASLIDVKGKLYGTTSHGGKGCHKHSYGCGTVFAIAANGAHELVFDFDPWAQGAYPQSNLIDAKGTFYGTTYEGGAHGYGTVYSVSPSGSETVVYSLQGQSDGGYPVAPVVDVKGTLYGTTSGGGAKNGRYYHGTVYSVTRSGVHVVLHKFKGFGDGAYPDSGLVAVQGTLYGTTPDGGDFSVCTEDGCGVVYSITPSGDERIVYRFAGGSDGQVPESGLIDVNGTLYGTTAGGGTGSAGTVYSITTSGQKTVLYNFTGHADGGNPRASLLYADGTLYGTTYGGGTSGDGTVFSVTLGGTETVLHSFAGGTDGKNPIAGLVDVNGTLYGTTGYAGLNNNCCGTVFALTP
jgi:uncharacterized repeat protein (TIGR03803 family)